MGHSNEVNWEESVWMEINEAVKTEIMKVRIAQKVFPTMIFDTNPTEVPNDVINFPDDSNKIPYLSILEGDTKPFVEIYQQFQLTSTQVSKETHLKTCKTLARMAAKSLALAEDIIIFQGNEGNLPTNIQADQIESTKGGLLKEASPDNPDDKKENKVTKPIYVEKLENSETGAVWGEKVFSKVAEGRAILTSKSQAPNYALFLPTKVYADTHVPPSSASLVTTAERIKPLVEGGFYGTGTLPEDRGLLVALGGDPTSLYVGHEATTEFVQKEGSKYLFRVVERIQFVARDPRAFVLLEFEPDT
jgi:uncharacterized linocin/CFP29 family protein